MRNKRRTGPQQEPADSVSVAKLCARIADEKKAENIVILDLRNLTFITDYFVIATGTNPRQMQAIADEMRGRVPAMGVRLLGDSPPTETRWILLDFGDVVVHLFNPESRAFYDLELLWGDAPRVGWQS